MNRRSPKGEWAPVWLERDGREVCEYARRKRVPKDGNIADYLLLYRYVKLTHNNQLSMGTLHALHKNHFDRLSWQGRALEAAL